MRSLIKTLIFALIVTSCSISETTPIMKTEPGKIAFDGIITGIESSISDFDLLLDIDKYLNASTEDEKNHVLNNELNSYSILVLESGSVLIRKKDNNSFFELEREMDSSLSQQGTKWKYTSHMGNLNKTIYEIKSNGNNSWLLYIDSQFEDSYSRNGVHTFQAKFHVLKSTLENYEFFDKSYSIEMASEEMGKVTDFPSSEKASSLSIDFFINGALDFSYWNNNLSLKNGLIDIRAIVRSTSDSNEILADDDISAKVFFPNKVAITFNDITEFWNF